MSQRTRRAIDPTRPLLTKDAVLHAAIGMADREGIDGLSMRKLAAELGYEVMSLYNHVANKDEILDGIVERAAAEIEIAPAGTPWKPALRSVVLSAHQSFLRHPWAAGLWPATESGPSRVAYMEALLRTMRVAGFPPGIAYHGYHALMMHVLGFSFLLQHLPLDDESVQRGAERVADDLDPGEFPYLVEHMHQHVHGTADGSDFEFVLDLILDGLDRARRRR